MARPRKKRTLESEPRPVIYIPSGHTHEQVEPVAVAIEDFEVMRLVDGHAHSIEEAAVKVGVARSTAGRMLERARRAIALGIEHRAPVYLDALESSLLNLPDPDGKIPEMSATPADLSGLAIAANEEDTGAEVSRIFGRAKVFAIVGRTGSVHYEKNPGLRCNRDAAEKAVDLLKARDARRVVAGRFGPEALELLGAAKIKPIIAIGTNLNQAIELFLKNKNVHRK